MCLHQCHRAQLQVPLPLIKSGPLLPQHLVEIGNLLAVSSVLRYLLTVLLPGSLGLGPLLNKRSTVLGKGLLGDPRLLLPLGEDLFPLGKLPPPPERGVPPLPRPTVPPQGQKTMQ
jgi:hypothetical protein